MSNILEEDKRSVFINNYVKALGLVPCNDALSCVILEIIGSIYDLQQQISDLTDKTNEK